MEEFSNWMLLPKIMSMNVHFSILPKYRGASPIQSSLINGDKKLEFHSCK